MKLIAGIDPGMMTAVAVVDVESAFYQAYSSRNFSFSEVCDYLVSVGEPIIISVDTMHAPETVKRVAAAFSSRLYYPKRDLYIGEKRRITAGKALKNDHERDALAAALHAKSFFSPLFDKVDHTLEIKALKRLSADVKELLVKNEAGNIEQAIKLLLGEGKPQIKVVPRVIETKNVLELRRRIERLEKEKIALELRMSALEKENIKLRQPMRINEPQVARNLRKSLASIINEKKHVEEDYNLYKTLSSSYEILADVPEKGRIVVFKDGMDVAKLEKLEPRAIISDKFLDTTIPVIHPSKVRIQKIGNFLVADKADIGNALSKESFIEWLSQYKEMRRNEA